MKDSIKIQVVERKSITKEGIKRCQPNFRVKCIRKFPFTFHATKSKEILVSEIDTQDKIAEYIWMNHGEGTFDFRGCCHKKNMFRVSFITLAIVKVEDDHQGSFKYEFKHHKSRLKRYWFWGDK